MFHDVSVIVALPHADSRAALVDQISSLGFRVTSEADVGSVLSRMIEERPPDILFMGVGMDGMTILRQWVSSRRSPVAVLMDDISEADRIKFMRAGAWNVLRTTESDEVIASVVLRYGTTVMERRTLALVKRLWRAVVVLTILCAGLLGERVVELLKLIPRL